jgi:hypothetical protein
MKIRELARDWPPEVAVGVGDPAIAEPGDDVLSAQRYEGEKDHIRLKVRKKKRHLLHRNFGPPRTSIRKSHYRYRTGERYNPRGTRRAVDI